MIVLDLDTSCEKYNASAPASFLDIDDAILHRNPMNITIIGIYIPEMSLFHHIYINFFAIFKYHKLQPRYKQLLQWLYKHIMLVLDLDK